MSYTQIYLCLHLIKYRTTALTITKYHAFIETPKTKKQMKKLQHEIYGTLFTNDRKLTEAKGTFSRPNKQVYSLELGLN